MKQLYHLGLICLALYLLYLVKSAVGINLSQKYSAWGIFKLPIAPLLHSKPLHPK
jgi:hypothetical protein